MRNFLFGCMIAVIVLFFLSKTLLTEKEFVGVLLGLGLSSIMVSGLKGFLSGVKKGIENEQKKT